MDSCGWGDVPDELVGNESWRAAGGATAEGVIVRVLDGASERAVVVALAEEEPRRLATLLPTRRRGLGLAHDSAVWYDRAGDTLVLGASAGMATREMGAWPRGSSSSQ